MTKLKDVFAQLMASEGEGEEIFHRLIVDLFQMAGCENPRELQCKQAEQNLWDWEEQTPCITQEWIVLHDEECFCFMLFAPTGWKAQWSMCSQGRWSCEGKIADGRHFICNQHMDNGTWRIYPKEVTHA